MALTEDQQDQVDELKRLVGDPLELDDDDLYEYITSATNLNDAAARVWNYKATQYAGLIDVKEGTSSRPLSQLRVSALAMSDRYAGLAKAETPSASSKTRTRAIVRP